MTTTYADSLKHPQWQRKRLRILEIADFKCERCGTGDQQLHAHHKVYIRGRKPWEYDDNLLECLCEFCHDLAHDERAQLELLIARQPTSAVPALADALLASVYDQEPPAELAPHMLSVFDRIGHALKSGKADDFTHAQNALQDLRDERADFQRGRGG